MVKKIRVPITDEWSDYCYDTIDNIIKEVKKEDLLIAYSLVNLIKLIGDLYGPYYASLI